jgi:hypothetical protein
MRWYWAVMSLEAVKSYTPKWAATQRPLRGGQHEAGA